MTATKIKQIEYLSLMKTFKNFVMKNGKESQQVLNYVYFDGKYFIATNTHVLLKVNSEYIKNIPDTIVEGSLFDVKEMYLINSKLNEAFKYPNVNRLIPNVNDFNTTISLDGSLHILIKDMKELCKTDRILSDLTQSKQIAILDTGNKYDNKFTLSIKGENEKEKIKIDNVVTGEPILLHMNAKYLIDALAVCKKLTKLNSEPCTLKLLSRLRPMNFRQENVFDLIVLPVRVY